MVEAVVTFFAEDPFFPSIPFTPLAPCKLLDDGHFPFAFGPEIKRLRVSM
jgi:hypothetical protein